MVYIKIALSYPRFQFSFQGAFDTVEVLRKPPAASTTPTAPPPALPLPVHSGAPKTARVHARRRPRGPAFVCLFFFTAPMSSLEKTSAHNPTLF